MAWSGWRQDLKGAWRQLARRPGVTLAAVLSLTLGIGANATVFTLVNAVLLHTVPVRDPARVVSVYTQDARNAAMGYLGSSYMNLHDVQTQNTVFSAVSAVINSGASWLSHGRPQPVRVELVNADFFPLLGEPISPGRDFLPEENSTPGGHPVAIVSHGFWVREMGGERAAVGRNLNLNGLDYTVVGVAPAEFEDVPNLGGADLWVPIAMHDQILTGIVKQWFNQRRPLFAGAVARLKPGVSLAAAQSSVHALAAHLGAEFPTDDAGRNLVLVPLSESNVPPNQRANTLLAGTLLMSIAGLVLLIACANVANLLLVRATERKREFAIRLALGAGRGRLLRQLLAEGLLLGLVSGVLAVGFAFAARNALWALRPAGFGRNLHPAIDGAVLAFTFATALVATLLFALAPALQATRTAPLASLRDRTDPASGATRWYGLRGLLVALQVAFALIAVLGASLFVHSLINAQHVATGFDTDHLVALNPNLQAARYSQPRADQFYRDAVARLGAMPQVAGASITDTVPFQGGMQRTTFPGGVDTNDTRNGKLTPVTAVRSGYFRAMGIPLLRGRDFTDSDGPNAPLVAVINQTLADRLWPGQNPLGKHLSFLQETWDVTVVGEVPTVTYASLGEAAQAQVYFSYEQQPGPASILVRTAGDPEAAVASLQAVVRGLDPSLPPPRTVTIASILDLRLAAPKLGAELLAVFGILALLLAAVGTYGVMSYAVAQRTREIGVRMALGARRGDIRKLILGSGLAMIGVGLAAGVLAAAAGGRGLGALLYGITGLDPVSFVLAPAVLLAAGLLACWLPSRRAMRVDPNTALRDL